RSRAIHLEVGVQPAAAAPPADVGLELVPRRHTRDLPRPSRGVADPIWLFDLVGISHSFKQWMAIVVGGIAGVFCLIGIALLTHRRLFDVRIRTTSSFSDIAILLLLFAQLLLGLATIPVSMGHLDGHEMVKFMNWAQGILLLRADASTLVADAHPLFK